MRRVVALVVAVVAAMVPTQPSGAGEVTRGDCEQAVQATARSYRQDRPPDPTIEQLARDCTTIAQVEVVQEGGVVQEAEAASTLVGTAESGSGCRTIADGRIYYNGFGYVIAKFVGYLHWCFQRGRTTGGSFWMSIDRCCFWYYEGTVHSQNGGCFNGCAYVSRYRLGSFVFNPPWPTITTRVQPWFRLRGNGDGTATTSSGG